MKDTYFIKVDFNKEQYITNKEGNIHFYLKRGFSVEPDEIKILSSNTILIDGVFNGPPFLDNDNKIYSLDHHKGIIRSFTLSSCEQALLLIYKGFNINEEPWNVYGNEPDLDTILVAWIFLNNLIITENKDNIRHDITRLVRVEGLIDSQGYSFLDYLGYNEEIIEAELRKINKILEQEKSLKENNEWEKIDPFEYVKNVLCKIDMMFFEENTPSDIEFNQIEVIPIHKKNVIVSCKSSASIYEIEKILRQKYKSKLALIILQSSSNKYTIKLTNEFLNKNLFSLYSKLNKFDKTVKSSDPTNVWGGSDLIGGSPRKAKTSLSINEIGDIAKQVFFQKLFLFNNIFNFIKK